MKNIDICMLCYRNIIIGKAVHISGRFTTGTFLSYDESTGKVIDTFALPSSARFLEPYSLSMYRSGHAGMSHNSICLPTDTNLHFNQPFYCQYDNGNEALSTFDRFGKFINAINKLTLVGDDFIK